MLSTEASRSTPRATRWRQLPVNNSCCAYRPPSTTPDSDGEPSAGAAPAQDACCRSRTCSAPWDEGNLTAAGSRRTPSRWYSTGARPYDAGGQRRRGTGLRNALPCNVSESLPVWARDVGVDLRWWDAELPVGIEPTSHCQHHVCIQAEVKPDHQYVSPMDIQWERPSQRKATSSGCVCTACMHACSMS